MTTPEARAREAIDHRLAAAGWVVQDHKALNLGAGQGVAVREYPTDSGPADYVLFVQRQAVGVIEAKRDDAGATLTATENQTARYATANATLPSMLDASGAPVAEGPMPEGATDEAALGLPAADAVGGLNVSSNETVALGQELQDPTLDAAAAAADPTSDAAAEVGGSGESGDSSSVIPHPALISSCTTLVYVSMWPPPKRCT